MPRGAGGGGRRVYWRRCSNGIGGCGEGASRDGVDASEGGDEDPVDGAALIDDGDHCGSDGGDPAETDDEGESTYSAPCPTAGNPGGVDPWLGAAAGGKAGCGAEAGGGGVDGTDVADADGVVGVPAVLLAGASNGGIAGGRGSNGRRAATSVDDVAAGAGGGGAAAAEDAGAVATGDVISIDVSGTHTAGAGGVGSSPSACIPPPPAGGCADHTTSLM